MKQRALTDIQLTVLKMHFNGRSNLEIAAVIGVHPATVSCKLRDIRKGMAKGAYHNLPQELNLNGDLFGA